MPTTTISEVLSALDEIISVEISKNSPMAYFPILYREVTARIAEGVANNEFENGSRMETLDVIFANRYLVAYQDYQVNKPITKSWKNAFDASTNGKLLIMQHLLLGINAHINLDLGIAVALTVGENGNMKNIENDFNKINEILSEMVAGVEAKIIKVSPLFGLLDKWGKGKEDKLVSFSINVARDGAWLFANQFHIAVDHEDEAIQRDIIISKLAKKLITQKSFLLKWLVKIIRFFEKKNVGEVTSVLQQS